MAISLEVVPIGKSSVLRGVLLNAATSTTNGEWVEIAGYQGTVHITGITTATVEVDVSNEPSKPLNTTHGITLSSVTANAGVVVNSAWRWIKVRCTSYTSGTISAYWEGIAW
jgi:hypothetical protein